MNVSGRLLVVTLMLASSVNCRGVNVVIRDPGEHGQNTRNVDYTEYEEILTHKVRLLEQSVSGYVHEFQPQIADLQEKLYEVKEINERLQSALQYQDDVIRDLRWAMKDIKTHELSREEKDTISELRWTTWDLKQANYELQEEACYRSSRCSEWTSWTECSVTCGMGTQSRSRECTKTGRFQSMCEPLEKETRECKGEICAMTSLSRKDCQEGYVSFHGYCLRFSGQQASRLVSQIACEDEDAHIVYVDRHEKQALVEKYLKTVAPEYMKELNATYDELEYWDTTDIDTKTNVALDGIRPHQRTEFYNWRETEMTYFHWAEGEPRNSKSDRDYCVTLNVNTGRWYMKCCSVTLFYICEANSIDF